jgi:hypothetical protein
MKLVSQERYSSLVPRFRHDIPNHPIPLSFLAGHRCSRVLADHAAHPTTALVVRDDEGEVFVGGNPKQDLFEPLLPCSPSS